MPPITFGFSGSPKKEQGLIQYTTDLPSLTPSSSWSSILSSLWSVDTSNDALPDTVHSPCDSPKIQDTDRITMGPPRCRGKKGRDGPVGVARYDPVIYRCSGYVQKGYEWFSGLAEAKDQRFLIDLEHRSMDRLPDVRPFLYFVGYYKGDRYHLPNVDRYPPEVIEDFFVAAGRDYLLAEKRNGCYGYFLEERNWSELNCAKNETMPYAVCPKSEAVVGDVGFSEPHNWEYRDEDTIRGTDGEYPAKSNIRVPLPREIVTAVRPGDPEWDASIIWLYSYKQHPVRFFVDDQGTVATVHAERRMEDVICRTKIMTSEASSCYPTDWSCPSNEGMVGCKTQ